MRSVGEHADSDVNRIPSVPTARSLRGPSPSCRARGALGSQRALTDHPTIGLAVIRVSSQTESPFQPEPTAGKGQFSCSGRPRFPCRKRDQQGNPSRRSAQPQSWESTPRGFAPSSRRSSVITPPSAGSRSARVLEAASSVSTVGVGQSTAACRTTGPAVIEDRFWFCTGAFTLYGGSPQSRTRETRASTPTPAHH